MDIRAIGPQHGLTPPAAPAPPGAGVERSFLDTLKATLAEVNTAQVHADQAVTDLVTGKQSDLHQTMIAIEKADLSFQTMMQVRNKIIAAYEEITRMQI